MTGDTTRAPAETNCLACGAALPPLRRVRNEPFCGEFCRHRYETLAPHQVCAGCARPLSPHQYGSRVCGSFACWRRVDEQNRERERRRREGLRGRAVGLRDREAAALGIVDPGRYVPAVVPASRAPITNLPERRRRAFRDHLNRLIGAATAVAIPVVADPADAPSPEVSAVLGRACALCRGYCCGGGGNHAYLTADTVRRYLAEHPDQRPRDVLAAYAARVGNRTVKGSCVFHGAGGCNLPRGMRSNTCNRFFCTGLKEFRAALAPGTPALGFIAATEGDVIVAAAFDDAGGSRPVPPPLPGPGGLPSA